MGGLKKTPSEGGSGGRRGHSGMEHWARTDEIKTAARTRRRIDDRNATRDGFEDQLVEGDLRVLDAFPITGRGTAVVIDVPLEDWPYGRSWQVSIHTPDGRIFHATADLELVLKWKEEAGERPALLLQGVPIDNAPVGTIVRIERAG
jgi:hypothetical protein